MEIEALQSVRDVALAVVLQNLRGLRLITSWTKEAGFHLDLRPGRQTIDCRFEEVRLRPGHQVTGSLWMSGADVIDCVDNVFTFQVMPADEHYHYSTNIDQGPLLCNHSWSVRGAP